MNALVGGPLLVGGLGPGTSPPTLKSGPALYSFMAGPSVAVYVLGVRR